MTGTQVKVSSGRRWRSVTIRVGAFLLFAVIIGTLLNYLSRSLERRARPAGFSRGVLQGVLMPMSMPNLLVGRDVTIYSQNNTGVSYKLGYTAGVNGCGAIFFGVLFWRLHRLRKGA
jgi:hypothetical protein